MGVIIPIASRINPAQSQMTQKTTGDELAGVEWPPREDRPRLAAYSAYRLLWEGDHQSVLVKSGMRVEGEYISVNIPKVIVTIPADILFGEDLTLTYPDDTPEGDKERIEDIWERNDLQTLLYENALDTGYSGDGVWSVGRNDTNESVIKTHPADTWFPETDPDNVRELIRHRIAWERKAMIDNKEVEFLRVVVHDKGKVTHELYRIEKGKIATAQESDWDVLYPNGKPEETQDGVEGEFLVEHVPNFRTARTLFGQSAYVGVEDLFASLNARMTQVDGILDRHSDPVLGLPHAVMAQLTNGGKRNVDKADLDIVVLGENGEKPEYLTWDGKLADNMAFIDALLQQIAMVSDTAPQLLGRKDWGADISGRALKILLIRTLAKVGTKRRYYDRVIPRILERAQQMEGVTDPVHVGIDWPDGLPTDMMEVIEEVDRRITNQTMSRKAAVKRLDGVSDEEAEDVLAEIEDDDKTEAQAVGEKPKPVIPVNVNMGEVE